LLPEHHGRPELERRFLAEARVCGRLQHPGVVPVYALGRLNDRPFFAMKLVEGATLAELLERRASPAEDLGRFLVVFEQVAQTVGYAHSQGGIHRDLKPANIMVGEFGEVQLMDWGLAKHLASPARQGGEEHPVAPRPHGQGSPGWTQAGSVLGTPAYMSPEQ